MENKFLLSEIQNIHNRYFSHDADGKLCVHHGKFFNLSTPVNELLAHNTATSCNEPCIMTFFHILKDKLSTLYQGFHQAINDFCYKGNYEFTYPIKVNPNVEIMRTLQSHANTENKRLNFEVGSKSELLSVLSMATIHNKIICNGFKDMDFYQLANLAGKLGYQVIMVIEHIDEMAILHQFAPNNTYFYIGFRIKPFLNNLHTAKFGLALTEINHAKKQVISLGLADKLILLHGHIGSQLQDLADIKKQINHLMVVYKSLLADCPNLTSIDIGGGLAANYINSDDPCYIFDYYAKNIVGTFCYFADLYKVRHPDILTESGRAITSDASLLIIHPVYQSKHPIENEHIYNDQMQQAWLDGTLSFEALEEMNNVCYLPTSQLYRIWYNFSVFQSLPDHWGIAQMFPVLPLENYNKDERMQCQIFDISCDADGILRENTAQSDITLPMSDVSALAVMMIGSYQEMLSSKHNIIGKTKKIEIDFDVFNDYQVNIIPAENHESLIQQYGHNLTVLQEMLMTCIEKEISNNDWSLLSTIVNASPYLSTHIEKDQSYENHLAC
ncbi:type III PLP-dependent enzyme domain-containing protein [Facilibium subflavum]|uniref:arginine decarboxylase n=1 Tax=Facilibium subflavum TaxID=2219058 RepID=UPI000E65CC7A|nr:arginine decarboxylase [Facilibium subflavum]